jgi:hypothetical protein
MSRLPSNRRVKNPPPMRLTPRDVEIIKAVYDFRALRGDQIQTLFFGSQSTASYRLSRLYQHCFLERHFLPMVGGPASSPTIYTLDKQGARVLREICGYGPEILGKQLVIKEFSQLFIEHLLQINEFRISVVKSAGLNGYILENWLTDAYLRSDYDRVMIKTVRGHRRQISLIPDSYFVLLVPQGRACFFLELDRGTMTLGRFSEKILAYQSYIESGQYHRRYNTHSLRVLIVTLGEKRLLNLKRKTEAVGGEKIFWFTTLSEVSADSVLDDPIWLISSRDSEKRFVLIRN